MLRADAVSDDLTDNLQLALGIELAVLPPYLYALWSIQPPGEGGSPAAQEAARTLRAVAHEEMLHAGLVINLLNAVGAEPDLRAHPMSYPGPLPGHAATGPDGYTVGLAPLSADALDTFCRIEQPEWKEPAADNSGDWVTLGAFYELVRGQLRDWSGGFGAGRQLRPADNPGPGEMIEVTDLASALEAVQTIVDQGEGHQPPEANPNDPLAEDDDDHEVAHYDQFLTLGGYLPARIDPARDVYPLVTNPDPGAYSEAQRQVDATFSQAYTALLDGLQDAAREPQPRAWGAPTELMSRLRQLAAQLRAQGPVPGTEQLAGPSFHDLAATR